MVGLCQRGSKRLVHHSVMSEVPALGKLVLVTSASNLNLKRRERSVLPLTLHTLHQTVLDFKPLTTAVVVAAVEVIVMAVVVVAVVVVVELAVLFVVVVVVVVVVGTFERRGVMLFTLRMPQLGELLLVLILMLLGTVLVLVLVLVLALVLVLVLVLVLAMLGPQAVLQNQRVLLP